MVGWQRVRGRTGAGEQIRIRRDEQFARPRILHHKHGNQSRRGNGVEVEVWFSLTGLRRFAVLDPYGQMQVVLSCGHPHPGLRRQLRRALAGVLERPCYQIPTHRKRLARFDSHAATRLDHIVVARGGLAGGAVKNQAGSAFPGLRRLVLFSKNQCQCVIAVFGFLGGPGNPASGFVERCLGNSGPTPCALYLGPRAIGFREHRLRQRGVAHAAPRGVEVGQILGAEIRQGLRNLYRAVTEVTVSSEDQSVGFPDIRAPCHLRPICHEERAGFRIPMALERGRVKWLHRRAQLLRARQTIQVNPSLVDKILERHANIPVLRRVGILEFVDGSDDILVGHHQMPDLIHPRGFEALRRHALAKCSPQ